MRVKGVTPFLVDLGGGKNLLFVKVETEGGPHGWGECYTQADRDASIVAHVEALARYLVGREAAHITHFVHMAYHDFAAKRGAMDFWSAVSGLEQALWDIAGKRHGVPVHELLGGLPTICQATRCSACRRVASYSVPVRSMATRMESRRSATPRRARGWLWPRWRKAV